MLTRRLWRATALLLLTVAVVNAAEATATVRDQQHAAISATTGVAVVTAAVPDPVRPLVPLVPVGLLALAAALAGPAWRGVIHGRARGAGSDAARRRWRSRLVGAPPSASLA